MLSQQPYNSGSVPRDRLNISYLLDTAPTRFDQATDEEIALPVEQAIEVVDKAQRLRDLKRVEDRQMVKPNNKMQVQVVLRRSNNGGQMQKFMLHVAHSIRLVDFDKAVVARCGSAVPESYDYYWIEPGGDLIGLVNQEAFTRFVFTNWCTQPWVVHMLDGTSQTSLEEATILSSIDKPVSHLFDIYDVNQNGRVERRELLRMLNDLDLPELEVTQKLIERLVEVLYVRIDANDNEGIDKAEFIAYFASMTRWMRNKLIDQFAHGRTIFHRISSKAAESIFVPTPLPPPMVNGTISDQAQVVMVDTAQVCFGIRLEIPVDALEPTSMPAEGSTLLISVRTLAPERVGYLSEGMKNKLGEFPFSPIVRVDFPAFEQGGQVPDLGGVAAPHFRKPITLVMPHCFDSRDGMESCVILGAAHGATQWERLDLSGAIGDGITDFPVQLDKNEMRVKLPYAGTFCAFSSPEVEDIAAVRFHIFGPPYLEREGRATLRVHLCPNLPEISEEVENAETSEWGVSKRLASSAVFYIYQGVRFDLRLFEEHREIIWHGIRRVATFTIPQGAAKGVAPKPNDPDQRDIFTSSLQVTFMKGDGLRASSVRPVMKRAEETLGSLSKGYRMSFSTRLLPRRLRRPVLKLKDRTSHNFTVTWTEPLSAMNVTHYSIDLATSSPDGTLYPFSELWCGAAHAPPDFAWEATKRLAGPEELAALAEQEEDRPRIPLFSYTLEVDPGLSGQLTIRYWAADDVRPSPKSLDVYLPRWNRPLTGNMDAKDQIICTDRKNYFEQLRQHVTDGGKPVHYRHGNIASRNVWGGDKMPPPPPPTEKQIQQGIIMPPVPYDVPRLPKDTPGLAEAGLLLSQIYREIGVMGGGGGLLCGIRIDHVVHAVAGTPTTDGFSSPCRTSSSLRQPLMAYCEILYADIFYGLVDEAVIVREEWLAIREKVRGIVAQIATHRQFSFSARPHVKEMINILQELVCMLQQCNAEGAFTFHVTHLDYSKTVKEELKSELVERMDETVWKLSTELLQMQLELRKPFDTAQLAAGAIVAEALARKYRLWKKGQAIRLAARAAAAAYKLTTVLKGKLYARRRGQRRVRTYIAAAAHTVQVYQFHGKLQPTAQGAHLISRQTAAKKIARILCERHRMRKQGRAVRHAHAKLAAAKKIEPKLTTWVRDRERRRERAATRRESLGRAADTARARSDRVMDTIDAALAKQSTDAAACEAKQATVNHARANVAAKTAAKNMAEQEAEIERHRALVALEHMHRIEFATPGPNAKRANQLVELLESRLMFPSTKPQTSQLAYLFEPCGQTKTEFWGQPRIRPPSKAVAVDPSLLAELVAGSQRYQPTLEVADAKASIQPPRKPRKPRRHSPEALKLPSTHGGVEVERSPIAQRAQHSTTQAAFAAARARRMNAIPWQRHTRSILAEPAHRPAPSAAVWPSSARARRGAPPAVLGSSRPQSTRPAPSLPPSAQIRPDSAKRMLTTPDAHIDDVEEEILSLLRTPAAASVDGLQAGRAMFSPRHEAPRPHLLNTAPGALGLALPRHRPPHSLSAGSPIEPRAHIRRKI